MTPAHVVARRAVTRLVLAIMFLDLFCMLSVATHQVEVVRADAVVQWEEATMR